MKEKMQTYRITYINKNNQENEYVVIARNETEAIQEYINYVEQNIGEQVEMTRVKKSEY